MVVQRCRVLHVLGSAHPRSGGPITTTKGQIRLALSLGYGVTVACVDPAVGFGDTGADLVDLANGRLQYGILRQLVSNHDVTHIHGMYRPHTYMAGLAALRAGSRVVVEPHGSLTQYQWAQRRFRKALPESLGDAMLMKRASAVIAASQTEKADILKHFDADVKVVPHALGSIHRRPGNPDGKGVIFLGRLASKKRVDLLIASWPSVLRRHPDAILSIVGPGSKTQMRVLRSSLKQLDSASASSVRYLGELYGSVRDEMLASHSVFSLPSEDENFGNAIVEAIAWGLQVHATPHCGVLEYLPNDQRAIAVSQVDAIEIAEAISGLLAVDGEGRCDAVRVVQDSVRTSFGDEIVGRLLEEVYQG